MTIKQHDHGSGFTLVELSIVIAIIAIVAAMGVPKLINTRMTANEAAAIGTLRSLTTAQALVMSSGSIDTDVDGAGESAYFAELAGLVPARTGVGGLPAPGLTPLTPAPLAGAFGIVDANGLVARSGYYFQMWLPGAPAAGLTPGIAELPNVGGADPANFPDQNGAETLWCCYAWPIVARQTGNRAFFVNQAGDLLQLQNRGPLPYSSNTKMPAFDEAFVTPGDMGSGVRVGIAGGNDATIWVLVQ